MKVKCHREHEVFLTNIPKSENNDKYLPDVTDNRLKKVKWHREHEVFRTNFTQSENNDK